MKDQNVSNSLSRNTIQIWKSKTHCFKAGQHWQWVGKRQISPVSWRTIFHFLNVGLRIKLFSGVWEFLSSCHKVEGPIALLISLMKQFSAYYMDFIFVRISPRRAVTLWPLTSSNFVWKVESNAGQYVCLILKCGAVWKYIVSLVCVLPLSASFCT